MNASAKSTAANVSLVLLGAVLGALTALLLTGEGEEPSVRASDRPPTEKAPAKVAAVPDAGARALRLRIRQLEAELKSARAPVVTNVPAAEAKAPQPPDAGRPRSPREWLENLKKNDPKRYEAHQKWMSRMREHHLKRTQTRLDFLGSIDTSGMSGEERANHEKLQELLAQRENLPDSPEEMTDEEMRAAGDRRRQLDQQIRKANETERASLLKQAAGLFGFEGEEAATLTATIQEVLRATESDHGPHGPPPGR